MYGYIFQLNHEYISKYTEERQPLYQNIQLGYFSTLYKAKEIVEKYKNLKGFCNYDVSCFKITRRRIDKAEIINQILYELYHSYIIDGFEEFEYLGVFSARKHAEEKIQKLIQKKAIFRKHPDGFDISEEVLDSENTIWNEGFDSFE